MSGVRTIRHNGVALYEITRQARYRDGVMAIITGGTHRQEKIASMLVDLAQRCAVIATMDCPWRSECA